MVRKLDKLLAVFKTNPKKQIKIGIALCIVSLFVTIGTYFLGDTTGEINGITAMAVGGFVIYQGRRKLREQQIAEEFRVVPKIGPLDF